MTAHPPTRWQRFLCWFLGHRDDRGSGVGWSGLIDYTCGRCQRTERKWYWQR